MQNTWSSSDPCEYELCSIASSEKTADNLPGPGRLLGKLYVRVGRPLENGLGKAAANLGHGPNIVAMKIRKIIEDKSLGPFIRRRKMKKEYKKLERYVT